MAGGEAGSRRMLARRPSLEAALPESVGTDYAPRLPDSVPDAPSPMLRPAVLVLSLLVSLVGASPARAACPSTGATLLQTAAQATAGYQARDKAAVQAAAQALQADLLCVVTVLDPDQAAAVHRALALSAFLDGRAEATRLAFRSARLADPTWELPTSLAPEGHPLRAAWQDAGAGAEGGAEPLGQRPDRRTWVDGRPATERPTDRPVVLQADLLNGTMVGSSYLPAGEALPSWAQVQGVALSTPPTVRRPSPSPSLEPAPAPREDRAARRRGPNGPLLIGGLGVGLVSGGLWAAAVVDGLAYERHTGEMLDRDYANTAAVEAGQREIDAHWRRVNALGYAAQATSAAGGLLLVGSFVF